MNQRSTRLAIIGVILAALVGAVAIVVKIYPDVLWFNRVNYLGVYEKILWTKLFMGFAVGLFFAVVTLVNLYLIYRFTPSRLNPTLVESIFVTTDPEFDLRKTIYIALALLAIGLSVLMGYSATERWEPLLRYFNAKDLTFQTATPIIVNENLNGNTIPVAQRDLDAKGLERGDSVTIKAEDRSETARVASIGTDSVQLDKEITLAQEERAVLVSTARDPIFNKNVNYYVFKMPLERYICGNLFGLFLLLIIFSGVLYFFHGSLFDDNNRFAPSTRVKAHLFILIGLTLLFRAWNYRFAMFDLLYTTNDVVRGGGGYAAIHARLPLLYFLAGFTVITALMFLATIFLRRTVYAVGCFGIFWVIVIIGQLYPVFVQKFRVEPRKQSLESEYINYNIKATLHAYDLEDDTVTEEEYPLTGELSYEGITSQANQSVINSVRLWDKRPLQRTFRQLQELRSQYDFADVDIDRYRMGTGEPRQVMLSGRELELPEEVRNDWYKKTYVYTHGYGAVMSPVNEIVAGKPQIYMQDIDPITYHDDWPNGYRFNDEPGPRIYYGERTNHYVIVHPNYLATHPGRTEELEFDYPETFGQDFAKYAYKGQGGVPLSSFWRRLIYMLKFNNEINFILRGEITPESRVLYHRNIRERVSKIAPFLGYDSDPYLVVHNGRLIWMIDAYTTTTRYPYSTMTQRRLRRPVEQGGLEVVLQGNYIRNAVKVTVDAYDGNVNFYLMERENDPIVECYARIFPKLFKRFNEMPEALKTHIRYPALMFLAQARIYQDYHMKDPVTFYASEDQWEIGKELYDTTEAPRVQTAAPPGSPFGGRQQGGAQFTASRRTKEQEVAPYYVVIRQPGEEKAEFMLMLPFTPKNKPNLIAWLAARCDLPKYGQLLVYRFAKGKLTTGPMQVENFISQEPEISQQISLWNTQGSRVLRGNLLIIPMDNSILYVEPIYIQSEDEETAIPELRRVVIGYGENVVWGESFDEALRKMFPPTRQRLVDASSIPAVQGTLDGDADPSPAIAPLISDLAKEANTHFERGQAALRAGNWAEYGQHQRALEQTLNQLLEQSAE